MPMDCADGRLEDLFAPASEERIGVEVELAVLNPETGCSVPYGGGNGLRAVLSELSDHWKAESIHTAGELMGVALSGEAKLTLEHGGAIEYSSAPAHSLVEVVEQAENVVAELAAFVRRFGLRLVPGANFPFDRIERANWVPKPYGAFMREHFARLGEQGIGGATVMAHTTSVQVTLDYRSEFDMLEKARAALLLTPVVVALFANSPIERGAVCASLSRRTEHWATTDPRRCGVIPPLLTAHASLAGLIDWALDLPMLYYQRAGTYAGMDGRSFRDILARGLPNGDRATFADWRSHISQTWPDVRIRQTIELRAADGPPAAATFSVAAFWVGLLYDADARRAIPELIGRVDPQEYERASRDAARRGLHATFNGKAIDQLAERVVRLAHAGLERRVASGREPARVLALLEPLRNVASQHHTFAHDAVARFAMINGDPAHFVAAFER